MVVSRATVVRASARAAGRSISRAMLLLLALLGPGLPASAQSLFLHRDTGGLASQLQVFDPAATAFSSLLSYGAMSVVAPILYGDFQSPTAVSSVPGFGGPMGLSANLDPAVSAMLNGTFEAALLPAGGPAEAEEFSVGPSDAAVDSSDGAIPSIDGASASDGIAGQTEAPSIGKGLLPECTDDETARTLQAGGKFWGPQTVSDPLAYFPRGVISCVNIQDQLGDLGPYGNRTNLSPTGPGGSWCRPGPTPFYLTSPLEEPLVWIIFSLLITGLLVFYLSRGVRLPA